MAAWVGPGDRRTPVLHPKLRVTRGLAEFLQIPLYGLGVYVGFFLDQVSGTVVDPAAG